MPARIRLFEDNDWRERLWRPTLGPEAGLAHGLTATFSDADLIPCKVAQGGTNLNYDWYPDGISKGHEDSYRGPLHPQLVAALDLLKTKLVSADK